mmetsp:Transcript_17202/g.42699  ORF Transcript_17202/g.42699 Transcript_17202/m.42699 type:complete len:368 (+) Transcript_17202:440-1543(+)
MVICLKSMLSRLAAASAVVPTVWCIDSSHLLRQETEKNKNLNRQSVAPSLQPSHSVGAATLEAAGESTVTWAPHEHVDQTSYPVDRTWTSPIVRGRATNKHGGHSDHRRQDPPPSNATFASRAMSTKYKRGSTVPAGLVEEGNDLRLCTPAEFEGEQRPSDYAAMAGNFTWGVPLSHQPEGSDYQFDGTCSCTGDDGSFANPGYWFVKFADGNLHHVAKIRLWNREDGVQARLNNACVRFTENDTMPLNNNTNCELYLPEIAYNSSGTEVVIDRSITGMMLLTTTIHGDYLHICGIQIYEDLRTSTSTSMSTSTPAGTTSTTSTTTAPEEEANHVVPIVIGGGAPPCSRWPSVCYARITTAAAHRRS